jgi:hypothetical protein
VWGKDINYVFYITDLKEKISLALFSTALRYWDL